MHPLVIKHGNLELFHDKTWRFEWEDHRTRRWIFHVFDYQRISWIFYDYLISVPTKPYKPYKTIQNHIKLYKTIWFNHIIQPYYPIYYPHVSKSAHFSLFNDHQKNRRRPPWGISSLCPWCPVLGIMGEQWESMGKSIVIIIIIYTGIIMVMME